MNGFARQLKRQRTGGTSPRCGRGKGFAFKELLVVLIVIGMLVAFLVPMLRAAKQRSYGLQCADHLRQIGQGAIHYMAENRGALPRTRASGDGDSGGDVVAGAGKPTWGTGAASPDPFAAGGPALNDVTAGPFLLVRRGLVRPMAFVCPLTVALIDDFARHPNGASGRSNFSDLRRNLSYSFANVYGPRLPVRYRGLGAGDLAYAADRNPGVRDTDNTGESGDDVTRPVEEAPTSILRLGNSNNHGKAGQNVLYVDGRVAWCEHPLVGCLDDNIFTRAADPAGAASDPLDPFGAPRDVMDSVLLPTDDE